MEKQPDKSVPEGISVIHFDDENKNIHATIAPDKEQAKKLSKRIFKDAMTAISTDNPNREQE